MEGCSLEVDSVADLWVTVLDESNVEDEVVAARIAAGSVVGSVAGSAPGIVAARATAVADVLWHHELASWDSQAGAIERYEIAVRDSQSAGVAESIGFPVGSVARPSAVASATSRYRARCYIY